MTKVFRFGQLFVLGFPKSFPFWKIRFGCKGTKNLRNATLFHKKKVIKIVNRLCFIESDDESRARTSFIYNKIKQTTKVSMNNSKYRGVVVPMVTPVTQDGRLDVEAVKRIINFFADNKGASLADAIKCWKWKKLQPGNHRYSPSDLDAVK